MGLPDRTTLLRALEQVNAARRAAASAALEQRLELALGRPSRRLALYGSLRRGQVNHGQIADLEGSWSTGGVRGRFTACAGSAGGWPTLVPDARAAPWPVEVLESEALPAHWARLDAFEGEAYRRELALVEAPDGRLRVANLYVPRD